MENDSAIKIVTDPSLRKHDTGGGDHPEIPDRLQIIGDCLKRSVLGESIQYVAPRPAARELLLTFHTEAWLFRFEESVLSGRTYIDHPDNQIGYESYDVATLSAGTGLVGVDLVEADPSAVVFCLTRPPGHHAEPNMPYGFCFFNNCVIAARYWQQSFKRRRVCIFDFDAHHGNGIQTAFEEDADTAYISIHEHPSFSYPGTGWTEERGIGEGKGTILNLPLPPGAGDQQVMNILEKIDNFVTAFKPDALVIGAGFDAHLEDDMSGLTYSTDLYHQLGSYVAGLADQHCEGRILSILEGGYHLEVLGACVEAYLTGIVNYDK